MPFTLVHPAATLPLLRTPLAPSALVTGALAPDLPYYVPLQWLGGDVNLTLTHAASSLLWFDPLVALVLLAAFHLVLKRPLTALLPLPAAARAWPAAQGFVWWSLPAAGWIGGSVVVGAATHLAWDGLGTATGSSWAGRVDLAGTVLGGAALVAWLVHWWRTTPPGPVPPGSLLPRRLRRGLPVALATVAVLAGAIGLAQHLPEVRESLQEQGLWNVREALQYGTRLFVVDAATALGAAVAAYAVAWHVTRRPRSPLSR